MKATVTMDAVVVTALRAAPPDYTPYIFTTQLMGKVDIPIDTPKADLKEIAQSMECDLLVSPSLTYDRDTRFRTWVKKYTVNPEDPREYPTTFADVY